MQDSQTPTKIPEAWAVNAGGAYINAIPTASQIGITNGAASFNDGFPPNSFIPLAAGGAGPLGRDMNGILNQVTSGLKWLQAGGPLYHDAAFSTAIGGYPAGALVQSDTLLGNWWQSSADNNVTDPDAAGAGWVPVRLSAYNNFGLLHVSATPGVTTYTVPAGVYWLFGQCQGAGAGGGGANSGGTISGGGGGAGGYIEGWFAVNPGDSITLTIGAGGAGGLGGTAPSDGSAGGSTSIGSVMTSTGGNGGQCIANAAGGNGGYASTSLSGVLPIYGGSGGDGDQTSVDLVGGNGGGSFFGGGGRSSTTAGVGLWAPGGGGGGGYSPTHPAGGTGAAGMIILRG